MRDTGRAVLENIGDRAFAGCVSLETVDLQSVKRVGQEAFLNCGSLKDLDFLSLPAIIMEGAFQNCDSLKEVYLGKTSYLRENVFYDCDALETVEFTKNSVGRTIDAGAFGGCENLKKIVLPDTEIEISPNAFLGSGNVVLYGYMGSPVESFASQSGYAFSSLGSIPENPYAEDPGNTELVYNGITYQGSIMFDTVWYKMPAGPIEGNPTANIYDIGVVMAGNANTKTLKVYSSRENIATVHKLPNGNYRVTGVSPSPGPVYIMLEVWDNGVLLNHYSVQVEVTNGISPYGQSARKRSYFN